MTHLKRFLKAYKWWDSKPPILLAIAYYQLLMARPAYQRLGPALLAIALFLLATVGIAGFGHLLNDLCDLDQDTEYGARNLVARRSRGHTLGLFAMTLLLSWLPWLWLPTDAYVLVLLAIEFGLFSLYSVPPVRLKGRSLFGAIADALYGYTIPVLVALRVFGLLVHVTTPLWFSILLGTWASLVGLRHILTHQLEYAARDQRSNVKTFVVSTGWRTTLELLSRTLLPAEAFIFLLVLLAVGSSTLLVPVGFVGHVAWTLTKSRKVGIWGLVNPLRLPIVDRLFLLNITVMSRFHTQWLPILLAAELAVRVPSFLVLLALQSLVFETGPVMLIRYDIPDFRRSARTMGTRAR